MSACLNSGARAGAPARVGAQQRSPVAAQRVALGALAGVFVAVLLLSAPPAFAQSGDAMAWDAARVANERMERSDYASAARIIGELSQNHPGSAAYEFMRGKYLFHMGEYDEALVHLDRALVLAPVPTIQTLRDLVAESIAVVADYDTYLTPDGLFEIRYDASRDAVLIPWAAETLEAAYYEIGYDVGYWPEPPVRVEIYPRARTLSRVSSLTAEAIEGSGTIALSKYNKLMFTSPRAALRGYGWRTTLAHEYVHYVVQHLTHADIPIWLHEALAKYLESRWTGSREIVMPPHREELLTERIAADNLITFEQMHPSMAYLPTPEDASTAYAEVFTVMEYMVERRGSGVIRELLARLSDGDDVVRAIERTIGESFEVFESNWMQALRGRPPVSVPGEFEDEVQLMPEASGDESVDRFAGVDSVEARDYLRLGELLRARNHIAAAIAEYEKAESLLGSANPLLQNALARAYLDESRPDEALEAVAEVVGWHPGFYRSHLHQGEALNRLGRHAEAVDSLIAAGAINPFDPAVHTQLALAYDALAQPELATRHRRFATMVSR